MLKRVIPYALVAIFTLVLSQLFGLVTRPAAGAPAAQPEASLAAQPAPPDKCQSFPETGKVVCGSFLQYWMTHGGLMQQGYPISNEFTEVSDLDGKPYRVQYFERAVFEYHPENKAPYDVLLSQLGTFRFKAKYPNGEPGGQSQGGTCGTIQMLGPNPPQDASALQAETCFLQAFQMCNTASLTVRVGGVDTVTVHNLSINGASMTAACIVHDNVQFTVVPRQTPTVNDYTCTSVTKKDGGILISGCSGENDIFIPAPASATP